MKWPCYPARPFRALFARISCNTFLESLKHTDQPWVVFVSGAWISIKNGLSLLCWAIISKDLIAIFNFIAPFRAKIKTLKTWREVELWDLEFLQIIFPALYCQKNIVKNSTLHVHLILLMTIKNIWSREFSNFETNIYSWKTKKPYYWKCLKYTHGCTRLKNF